MPDTEPQTQEAQRTRRRIRAEEIPLGRPTSLSVWDIYMVARQNLRLREMPFLQ